MFYRISSVGKLLFSYSELYALDIEVEMVMDVDKIRTNTNSLQFGQIQGV